uniref:Ribosome biogenesis protein NOP53 n=1 Tax=Elaeophora elaphi TaxID=1147741 RepID=A0A0R3S0L5_9BILA
MMSDNVKPSGKVHKCRISRNKKRYWKKGTQIQDAEDFLCEVQFDAVKGVQKPSDDTLFTVDKEPDHNNLKLTRRQRAALMKRFKKVELMEEESVSKRQRKKILLEKAKMPITSKAIVLQSTATHNRKPYDLWDQNSQKEVSVAEEYYLLTTKKKLPQEPKTLKHITSILQHVEVAPAGASYNPPVSKYLDYVTEAAEEEKRKTKENEKLERELALFEGKYATQEEIELELRAGLDDSSDNNEILEDASEVERNDCGGKRPITKRKTRKTRCLEYVERRRKEIENMSAFQKEQMHLIYSARKLNKEISREIQKREEFTKIRKEHKLMKRFAGTQRLGRGKFEPCEKSVLLTEELPGSLRELKPQGSILTERLKSLQKRNMLSIPGEKRQRRKLKNRLRIKEREDRKHQEVKLGTRLI